MYLDPLIVDPVEISVRQVAVLWCEEFKASTSDDRRERLRTSDGGDLEDAHEYLQEAFRQDEFVDELILEIISMLLSRADIPFDTAISYLAAGPVENRWNSGDKDLFTRLVSRGLSESIVSQIEGGVWK